KRIAGAEADADLFSVESGRQVLDDRSSGIDLEAGADALGIEGFSRRMRGRIGGDDLHRVPAVRQKTGVERIVAIGEVVLQQQPARFAVAAVVNGVDELVVVVVMGRPADADRVAVAHGGRWWIKARLPRSLPGRLAAGHMRNRLIAVSGLHDDVVNFGGDVLG